MSLRERLDMLAQYFLESTGSERCVILLREKDRLIPHAVLGVPARIGRLLLRQRLDVENRQARDP